MSIKSTYSTIIIVITYLIGAYNVSAQDASIEKKTEFLASEVIYFATDSSIINLQDKKVLLYHEAQVNYEDIELSAEYIVLNWSDNTVYAIGLPDSTGNMVGNPVFKEGGKTYYCESILYNFNTKKGKIKGMKTQDGDGYIHGTQLMKQADNSMYVEQSKYTTCSSDEPHFYIGAKKLKVIPGNKIITGPANLVIADIPTPLFIPFGFFPMQDKQSSGFIMPTYGYSVNRGYNFRNGGWYFSVNEHMDLALRGDIYTLGSWKLKAQSAYKKRYAYSGSFSLSYAKNILGEEGLSNFEDKRDFFIKWDHKQDSKAHPYRRFSANVNAGSSTFNQFNTYQNKDYLKNTLNSNISYSYSWPGKPFNFSANLRHSQNTLNKTVSLSLPDLAFSMNRINPFERKKSSGKQKWYEKISLNYTANAKNQIESSDSLLFKPETLNKMKYGLQHNIPISSSYKIFKYINISPSANYNEKWYFNRIEQNWDFNEDSLILQTDTIGGMRAVRNFRTSINMNTKIYGLYQFKSKKIKAIRHVISPNLSFSYRPDFREDKWGYYDWSLAEQSGDINDVYSYYEQGIYGTAPTGKSGNISLSIDNNLELKILNSNDSISEYKKIALFKNLNFRGNYNLAADSFNLSNITFTGRTVLMPKMNIKFNGSINPYQIDANGARIHKYAWGEKLTLGRLTNFSFSIDWSMNSSDKSKPIERPQNTSDEQWDMIQNRPNDYVDFNIPWDINVNYKYTYNKPALERTINQTLNLKGNVRLTEKWKIGFHSGYDFDSKKISYSSLDLYRDLHCWEMRFNWIPFGFHQSYNLSINVKSAVLQDLKLNKRKSFYDF